MSCQLHCNNLNSTGSLIFRSNEKGYLRDEISNHLGDSSHCNGTVFKRKNENIKKKKWMDVHENK